MIFAGGQMIQDGIIFDPAVVGPWVCERATSTRYTPGTAQAIGRVKAGQIVAGVLYQDFNGVNVFCHIAGEGRGWLDRRFLSIIFHYPFVQLKARRITGVVPSTNERARKFDEHLGFELEAILSGAHPEGDLCIYTMTAEKCRWLKELPYANP